jgi:hypothetical protein
MNRNRAAHIKRLEDDIQQAKQKLAGLHERCAQEDEMERQRDRARSLYQLKRTWNALRKQKKRKRSSRARSTEAESAK